METSYPSLPGDFARLTSPLIDGNMPLCIQFYYHMYGDDIADLSLYYYIESPDGSMKMSDQLWRKSGNQGDKWFFGHIYVEKPDFGQTRFIIEAIVD